MSSPPLHPDVEAIAFLLGTWQGTGHGSYPTTDSFDYVEETVFSHVGKPFVAYAQKTRAADDGRPLHAEGGYLRPVDEDRIELVVAHPSGHVEVAAGTVAGTTLRFVSSEVVGTPTAKSVTALERDLVVTDDVLRVDVRMAAVGEPLTHHLTAELRRG